MNDFKLKKMEEKQRIFEEQKKKTEINARNINLNVIQKNPETVGAILLGVLTFVLILLNAGFIWVIPIIFGARRLLKARKLGENKKFIFFGYIIVYILPLLFCVLSVLLFVYSNINAI